MRKIRFQFSIFVLLGIVTLTAVSTAVFKHLTRSPNMSKVDAMELAEALAIERFPGLELRDYDRTIELDGKDKKWWFFYDYNKRPRRPGDHFTITVNDETNEVFVLLGL